MPQLPNFPMKSQRRSPDANEDFDCVATCLASALQYELGRDFEPNTIKDMVYGKDYVGGLSAANFVPYAKEQGASLFHIDDAPAGLVKSTRKCLIELGLPVIATEPDPYANPALGWSHVICFYKWDVTTLTAMDPWTGGDVTHSDAEWANLFQFGQIWIVERDLPALLEPSPDDLHDWGFYKPEIPFVKEHGIPQSWLRGKRRGFNFGPVMEPERAVQMSGITFMECRCAGAKASWNSKTNQVTWWTANGPVIV